MISDEAAYLKAFATDKAGSTSWHIDASTDYLWCPVSVERAYSQYQHTVREYGDGFIRDGP